MIKSSAELVVLNAKYDASQKRKNKWKESRLYALQ